MVRYDLMWFPELMRKSLLYYTSDPSTTPATGAIWTQSVIALTTGNVSSNFIGSYTYIMTLRFLGCSPLLSLGRLFAGSSTSSSFNKGFKLYRLQS